MLMALGLFVFNRITALPDSIQNTLNQRYSAHETLDSRQKYQYIGTGEQTKVISGVLYPEFTGGALTLFALEKMMKKGESHILINAMGLVQGMYIIESISNTHTLLTKYGIPLKIEFTLNLKRTDDDKTTLDQATEAIGL